jgi:hypothetical protein
VIDHEWYPKQGPHYGKRVWVTFGEKPTKKCSGTIFRSDIEAPFETIIRLDGGRLIRSAECVYILGEDVPFPHCVKVPEAPLVAVERVYWTSEAVDI